MKEDVIVAKGQVNFETLGELGDVRVFFLLKAECLTRARGLVCHRLALVLKPLPSIVDIIFNECLSERFLYSKVVHIHGDAYAYRY